MRCYAAVRGVENGAEAFRMLSGERENIGGAAMAFSDKHRFTVPQPRREEHVCGGTEDQVDGARIKEPTSSLQVAEVLLCHNDFG